MKTIKYLSPVLALLLCSCVSYRHEHVNADQTKDVTRFGSFLMLGSASKIRSATKQGTNYSRTVSVGAIEGKGDVEFVEGISAGVARGMMEGLKKSQGIP